MFKKDNFVNIDVTIVDPTTAAGPREDSATAPHHTQMSKRASTYFPSPPQNTFGDTENYFVYQQHHNKSLECVLHPNLMFVQIFL